MRYYRVKQRYGEHAAALLVFATAMGVIALALAVWVLGAEWGLNNPGSKAAATLVFGGYLAVALWRPDLRWGCCCCDCHDYDIFDDLYTSPRHSLLPGNIHNTDGD